MKQTDVTTPRRIATLAATAAVVLAMAAAPAGAVEPTGCEFADHVRMAKAHTGFDGTHNPGVMHQGFSGWEAYHCS